MLDKPIKKSTSCHESQYISLLYNHSELGFMYLQLEASQNTKNNWELYWFINCAKTGYISINNMKIYLQQYQMTLDKSLGFEKWQVNWENWQNSWLTRSKQTNRKMHNIIIKMI